jgi:3-hydroxyisobutyrate dehydrogenase-like beta-hydroxyacid dehydrogenase
MTASTKVGLLHPGEMGAAIGAALVRTGHSVLWASAGRGDATAQRAIDAGLDDVGDIAAIVATADVILSICPPAAAVDVAQSVRGFGGSYVDANAVSPATSLQIAQLIEAAGGHYVDGGIIGGPPHERGDMRLYVAGSHASDVAALFVDSAVVCTVIDGAAGAASALKMAYAGWTKGRAALLITMRDYARAAGVDGELLAEWQLSLPGLEAEYAAALSSARAKGWRWTGEMDQIAESMEAVELPSGFHRAAAEVFGRQPRPSS